MKARYSETSRVGLRTLILPATLAAMVMALAVPSRAATISFSPSGNGTSVVPGISGFNYATSSVVATIGAPTLGATYNVFYESVISGTQGNVLPVGANFNLNNSGNEFTVIAGFSEKITGITLVPGGGAGGADAALINFSIISNPGITNGNGNPLTAPPNFFYIFANTPGSANPTTGAGSGFGTGTQVLSGFITSSFNGSFTENGTISGGGTIFTPSTTTFNSSGQATGNTTTTSVSGGGGTNLTVQVASTNANFFPVPPPAFMTFQTTNSLPFNGSVAPLTGFYTAPGGSTADLLYPAGFNTGTINGENGNSLMFSTVASSGFVIPEPSSIIPAMTAAMGVPLFLCALRRRSKKTGA